MEKHPDYHPYPLVEKIKQSPAIDLDIPYDPAWIKGKTVVITGGASGFGAGYVRRWAGLGANVIIGDISVQLAEQLIANVRQDSGNDNVHFVYCNVTDWQSQVNLFKEAAKLSPHGGIDIVVANAGIAGLDGFEEPEKLDEDTPPKPNLKTIEINLIGVLYTTHLALFWLQKNPGSKPAHAKIEPQERPRDRHLLLIGSMASLGPIPAQPLYAVSKHGVLGLFRTLRATCWIHGIRVNLVCPYFIDTPILTAGARLMLAGGAMGKPEDVIEAATRLVADTRIMGRSLYIGPKLKVMEDENGEHQLALKMPVKEKAIWEAFADDYEDSELFGRNIIRLLNSFARIRGWSGWMFDLLKATQYRLTNSKSAWVGK
ncbi:MAG: hypothetical protein M1828_002573 [Chrysothrix sp. TS-e1954]|nr:MAG: hypothetical protein M1828_002573 [Chrysothrix sp. TS-e1954]